MASKINLLGNIAGYSTQPKEMDAINIKKKIPFIVFKQPRTIKGYCPGISAFLNWTGSSDKYKKQIL